MHKGWPVRRWLRGLALTVLAISAFFFGAAATVGTYTLYISPLPNFHNRIPGECHTRNALLPYVECPEGATLQEFILNLPYLAVGLVFMALYTLPYWGPILLIVVGILLWRKFKSRSIDRPGR